MIWKKLLSILIIIVSFQPTSATIKLGQYKKFENQDLEYQFQNIQSKLSKFDTIEVKQKLNTFYQESIKSSNDYYTNLAISNYIDYYLYQGELSSIVRLYQENLAYPKTNHLLSYIQLLSKFYNFFYNYGIKEECQYILSQLNILKKDLPYKEQLYATAIINIYDGLFENDINKFDLKKSLLLEAIDIIEHLKNHLSVYEYKVRLSTAYNHLAIAYTDNIQITNENNIEFKKTELEHAASLIRKAIRINADYSYMNSAIYKSNLAYINNILRNAQDAIYYGNRSIFYSSKIKNKRIILRRSACNVADTYMIYDLTNSIAYQEALTICNDSKLKFDQDKEYVQLLLKSVDHPVEITIKKRSLLSRYNIYLIIGSIIFLLIIFLVSKLKKTQTT